MKRAKGKQSTEKSMHPLDVLLQETPEDSKSMLGILARRGIQIARDREPSWFKEAITQKIERMEFTSPDSKKDGQSFQQILKRAGVLEKFLSRSLQTDVEKWILLRDILKDDRKNKEEGKSDLGFPAQFHRSMTTALLKHLEAIEEIASKYNSLRGIEKYYSSVRREFFGHAKLLISFNCPPAWPQLLGETKLEFSPRDEEVSVRARVFYALKAKIQTQKSEKAGISDQFLWQLTELMLGAETESQLRTGRARYAMNSRPSPGNFPQKSEKS